MVQSKGENVIVVREKLSAVMCSHVSALLLHSSDYVDNNGHDRNEQVNPVLGTKE